MAQLSETSSVLWWSLSCRLRTVFRAFNALVMINGAAAHCTPRVIEPAVFWRLRGDFLSLCLIRRGCNILNIISFQRHPGPLFCCAQNAIFGKIFYGGEWGEGTATSTLKIWGNCLTFFRCLVCYAFHIIFCFFDSEIIFPSTWLKAKCSGR